MNKEIGKCPYCNQEGLDASSVVANAIQGHGLTACPASVKGVLDETDRLGRTLMTVATCSCGQDVSITFCPNGEIYMDKIDLGD